ncbi:MAG: GNAT family N-acetyltransferase [Helicobacter sp.]|uniref:GNAT family N-acetyltransferase n=1 Tax=Helicobacter sp. TaxID=218 RepID=UPI002A9166DB|nr:GNAT family N-acetyltransferase [Helicobacter sp.]MDY5949603.1 GNAT family N-acetyltransferase [Helicobacter sp.]
MQEISICSLKDNPSLLEKAQIFLLKAWADEKSENFYKEVLQCCVKTSDFIPHFLFAIDKDRKIIGCVGIALQDFVSCVNLYPFLVALYVEETYRNNGIASMLIGKAKRDCKNVGFSNLYLCSDLCGFYEKFSFVFHSTAYDVFGFNNRIYHCVLKPNVPHLDFKNIEVL